MQPSYPEFRKRLDDVLRQRDPQALRDFLVAEGQWDADTSTDPARAMWMMIATSPGLASLHADAIAWLRQHGYTEEAQALGGRHREGGGTHRPSQRGGRQSPSSDDHRRKQHRPSSRRRDRP